MKKGRFSAKYDSYADRLTSEGSCSTCPKSGLIVMSSRDIGREAVLEIAADAALQLRVVPERIVPGLGEALGASHRVREHLEARRRGNALDPFEPPEERNELVRLLGTGLRKELSVFRQICRAAWNPQECVSQLFAKRSWLKGMANSAVQPSASICVPTSQTASQLPSSSVSLKKKISCLVPAAFTPKTNPERLSS